MPPPPRPPRDPTAMAGRPCLIFGMGIALAQHVLYRPKSRGGNGEEDGMGRMGFLGG